MDGEIENEADDQVEAQEQETEADLPQYASQADLKAFEDRIMAALANKPAAEKPAEAAKPTTGTAGPEDFQAYVAAQVAAARQEMAQEMAPIKSALARAGMEGVLDAAGATVHNRAAVLDMAEKALATGYASTAEEAVAVAVAHPSNAPAPKNENKPQERRRGKSPSGQAPPDKAEQQKAEDADDATLAKYGI